MSSLDEFGACEICGHRQWSIVYDGPIRDGKFGNYLEGAYVGQCDNCNVQRLHERFCFDKAGYESSAYRHKLGQSSDSNDHLQTHDPFQRRVMDHVLSCAPRGRVVADIGCAGGAFLDHVRGLAATAIGIEPNSDFHAQLKARQIEVFPYARDVNPSFRGKVDLAVSFQVIEHTTAPRRFLEDILPLLTPGGELLLTTPNRRDILMELLPQDFRKFFYRVVHRWYFDSESLAQCALRAGFKVESIGFIHSYGLSNALAWLRDKVPTGWTQLAGIDAGIDAMWKSALEARGQSDILIARLSPDKASA